MTPTTLEDLYVDELTDLYSAERQVLKALPKMVKAATNAELKHAFEHHLHQTEMHVERIERIFAALDGTPKGKQCRGMEGVIEEGAELIEKGERSAVVDAGLIAKAQHVEHYEIAGYGSVYEWAMRLGHTGHATLLRQTLDEETHTDALLTDLARRSVNVDADVRITRGGETADVWPHRSPAGRHPGHQRARPSAEGR
jgi:ferritin-like metal-binding protein YciE